MASARFPWFVVPLVLLGCARAEVLHVDDLAPRPARDPDAVVLLLDEPAEPYRTIAVIRSPVKSTRRNMDALKREVRAEAARLGADAVILALTDGGDASGTGISPDGGVVFVSVSSELRVVGRAIVFTGREP